MIRWQDLDPAKVERAVKLLIRRLHPMAQGIDGAGGDDGRDIIWDSPEGLVIVEVKSYVDRLTNAQKRKIKGSLTKAAAHGPKRWILIVPLEPSPAETTWFDGLRRDFPQIELEWRGRDWLEAQFAGHDDLRRYVEGSNYELLLRAREMDREQAVLANGAADVVARVRRLHNRAQEPSLFWRTDFATRGETVMLTYSEAFPGAAEEDPVALRPTFTFPPDDPEAADVRAELERALEYGGSVTIDGRYVARFDIEASEETRRLMGADDPVQTVQLQLIAIADNSGLPVPCTFEVTNQAGAKVASVEVSFAERTAGGRGATLVGKDSSGLMTVTSRLDHEAVDDARHGSFTYSFDEFVGRYPYAIRKVADFILALVPGNRVSAHLGPACIGSAALDEDYLEEFGPVARLVVALDELQRHYGEVFPVPDDLTGRDLRQMEMVRELVTGERTRWLYRAIKSHIRRERLADFITRDEIRRQQGALIVRTDTMSFACGDYTFQVGPVQLLGPKMRLVNLPELEAAVGLDADPEARWVCMEDEHIYIQRLSNTDSDR